MSEAKKYPAPVTNPETAAFWEAAKQGKFMTKTETGRQLRIPREAGYDGEVFEVGAVG